MFVGVIIFLDVFAQAGRDTGRSLVASSILLLVLLKHCRLLSGNDDTVRQIKIGVALTAENLVFISAQTKRGEYQP